MHAAQVFTHALKNRLHAYCLPDAHIMKRLIILVLHGFFLKEEKKIVVILQKSSMHNHHLIIGMYGVQLTG